MNRGYISADRRFIRTVFPIDPEALKMALEERKSSPKTSGETRVKTGVKTSGETSGKMSVDGGGWEEVK